MSVGVGESEALKLILCIAPGQAIETSHCLSSEIHTYTFMDMKVYFMH